jgi:hypothetical protein
MRPTTLRLLASQSARFGLTMHRWDFVAAYLQGELLEGEVVYCTPPTGYRFNQDGTQLPYLGACPQRRCRRQRPHSMFVIHSIVPTSANAHVMFVAEALCAPPWLSRGPVGLLNRRTYPRRT